jgi:hypothetical protein
MDKVGFGTHRLTRQFDDRVSLQDFFPEDPQLKLGQPVAHAVVDAKPKGKMMFGARSVNDELVRLLNGLLVTVG